MKVLIIHCTYKYKGGEDTVVMEEMKLLQANGIIVELLQFENDGDTVAKLLQLPFNIGAYNKTRKKLRSFAADVVHVHNWHFAASPSVLYAVKKFNIPFVITLHNYRLLCPSAILFHNGKLFLDSLHQQFPWRAIQLGVYKNSRLLTLWLAFSMQLHYWLNTWKICSRFIVLTSHAKNIFLASKLKFPDKQVTIKPNFCTIPPLASATPRNYFLFVGRLSEEKGIDLLLRTFAACNYSLKIAGDGPLLEQVKDFSSLYPDIEYLGILDKSKVFDLLNNCAALVFPSMWYEGMPLTIIEAFACGVPVIASRLGAMESMISDGYNGLHFDAGNEQDLKAHLDQWQSFDETQQAVYKKNARLTYEEYYTPEKNFKQLLKIYEKVIAENGVRQNG